jgi:putative transport protein
MRWYEELITGTSVAGVLIGLGVAAAAGLALGSIKVKGLSLGIAGVLFTGIAFSDLCWSHSLLARLLGAHRAAGEAAAAIAALERTRRETLELLREIGLVLFVYSIGLQVGPGFFSSLRARGLRWNALAVSLVAMNLACAALVHRWFKVDAVATVGLLSGAVTNTPGLAAAEQALRDVPRLAVGERALAAVGYAVAYPFGVAGAIASLLVVRVAFRVDRSREAAMFGDSTHGRTRRIGNIDLCVTNPALAGQRLGSLTHLLGAPVVVSRMMREGRVELPAPDTELAMDDRLHVVGDDADLERLAVLCGERSDLDLREVSRRLDVRKLVVTRREVVGEPLGALQLSSLHGVNVTRLVRAGLELVPDARARLNFGDTLVAVGDGAHLAEVEGLVGNAAAELEHAHLVPVFVGIAAGVLIGSIPFSVAGLPAPLRLGMAGGPLLVALLFSHLGRVGRVSFYLPTGANLVLRDLGIALFLGCVGLLSGERFVDTIVRGPGLQWMLAGALITLPPLLATELVARIAFRVDYTALSGVVAGAMTSPSVLAFASQEAGDGALIAYGAVYPLSMILRVVCAQLLVIFWVGGPLR